MISDEAAFTEAQHTRDQAGLGLIAGRVTASLSGAATPRNSAATPRNGAATPRNSAATLRNTVERPVFGAQSTVMASKPGIVVSATVTLAVLFAALGMALIATGHLSRLSILISATAVVYLAVAFVGAAILRTQPRSRTGWIFLISGTAAPIGSGLNAAADAAAHIGRIDIASWIYLAQTPFSLLGVPLMATFGILLFPDRLHVADRAAAVARARDAGLGSSPPHPGSPALPA